MMFADKGTVIDGKFTLIGTIGHGGMGVVYEACQLGLDRVVALKLLASVPEDSQDEVVRFEREALILSKLSHANIVQFYAYGTWSGFPYIAMERLVGDNLHKLLAKNEPLPLPNTIEYVSQICDGLEHAHAHGIFHRDIKPTNIVLSTAPGGRMTLKIIDFGLAKLTGNNVQKLTQTNTALGTVMYMSPEQCTGQLVDHRSDIYSLGCLLYHCLTGEPPYCADNAVAVMFQQVNEPVQNTAGWKLLPSTLQQVISRCMGKDPADRFQSCAELRDNLIQAAQSESVAISISSPNQPPSASTKTVDFYASKARISRKKFFVGAVLAASLLLASGFGWYTSHKTPLQRVNHGAMMSFSSPKESMTGLIHRFDRLRSPVGGGPRLNPVEVEQLAQASEQFRHDPDVDANGDLLQRAYLILSLEYDEMGELEKMRSALSAGVERSGSSKDSFSSVNLLCRYHDLCVLSGCELSLIDKLRGLRQRFPNLRSSDQGRIDLMLSRDYAKLGRYAEAREQVRSAVKTTHSSGFSEQVRIQLKTLSEKEEAIKQIRLLSQQMDEQSRLKKATDLRAYQLAQCYHLIGKDPTDMILKQLDNPANAPFEQLMLRCELGRSYLEQGNRDKCVQVWEDLLEPVRKEMLPTGRPMGFLTYYQVVSGLALIYLDTGRYQECINLTEQWPKKGFFPKGPRFYTDSITVLRAHAYRRLGATVDAERLYTEAIANLNRFLAMDEKQPQCIYWRAEARCGLACLLYSCGRYRESLATSRAAAGGSLKSAHLQRLACCRFIQAACLEQLDLVQDAAKMRQLAKSNLVHVEPDETRKMWCIFPEVAPGSALATK